jgi:hypothetical protein
MTDNEIIKALEDCWVNGTCEHCSMKKDSKCKSILRQTALDLINRQKAEIKELDEKNVITFSLIGYQKTEIERIILEANEEYKNRIRAEAITEFEERLEEEAYGNDLYDRNSYGVYAVTVEEIRQIAKEMKGRYK